MTEIATEGKKNIISGFHKLFSTTMKTLIKPLQSNFQVISEYKNVSFASITVWLILAQTGFILINSLNGNKFDFIRILGELIVYPIFVILFVHYLYDLFKDTFQQKGCQFYDLLRATASIYFASMLVCGALSTLAILQNNLHEYIHWVISLYQVVLVIITIWSITKTNILKIVFAVVIASLLASLAIFMVEFMIQSMFHFVSIVFFNPF
jgi:hypothetical protein